MISRVQLSQAPLNLGEFRELQAWSDRPMSVSIECFVEPPTPAQLNACNECGSFPLASGQVLRFTAPSELFAQGRGYMKISVSDASGPQQSYTLPVATAGAQGLTESYKNAVTLATEKLREAIDRLDKRVKELGEVIKKREKLAKILKGATVLIGIFVATGFLPQVVVQILGVVVLIRSEGIGRSDQKARKISQNTQGCYGVNWHFCRDRFFTAGSRSDSGCRCTDQIGRNWEK